MSKFDNNRKLLYDEIPNDYKKYKNAVLTLEQFIAIWFKDENNFSEGNTNLFKYLNDNVENMFTKNSKVRLTLKSKRTFWRTFACDLEWAKKYNYCEDINVGEDTNIDLNEYIGIYNNDNLNLESVIENQNGQLSSTMFGYKLSLTSVANDVFKLSVDLSKFGGLIGNSEIGEVTFTRDAIDDKVNGLDFRVGDIPAVLRTYLGNIPTEAHLDKWSNKKNKQKTDSGLNFKYFKGQTSDFNDLGKNNEKKQSDYKTDLEKRLVHLSDEPIDVQMPDNIHDCDENAETWEMGCKNKKIAEINKWVLGKELNGVLTKRTIEGLSSYGLSSENENTIKNSVHTKLKTLNLQEAIIKNVVIKNLNELIKQNK